MRALSSRQARASTSVAAPSYPSTSRRATRSCCPSMVATRSTSAATRSTSFTNQRRSSASWATPRAADVLPLVRFVSYSDLGDGGDDVGITFLKSSGDYRDCV